MTALASPVALWHLARPRMVPFVLLLPGFGWAWAHWDRALPMQNGPGILAVFAGWVALNTGTLWLNAALDRDEGDVLMGRSVTVPDGIAPLGYLALLLCPPLAAAGSLTAGLAGAACVALSIAYSHPSLAWKGHPVLGPFVNVVGYGVLSPLAGWSAAGVPTNPRTLVVWALFAVGILAPYLAAQAFQRDEDAARGYRTFVVVFGPRATLHAARVAMGVVMGGGVVLAAVGWFPRVCLLAAPLGLWVDALLARWAALPDGGDGRWAARFAGRALLATGVLVAACFAEYARASLSHEPVAGLGTVAGHPGDRPRLAPFELRRWEARHGIIGPGAPHVRAD